MENFELYVNSINEIYNNLDILNDGLQSDENSANINNLNEYKELAISFAKLINNNSKEDDSLMPNEELGGDNSDR